MQLTVVFYKKKNCCLNKHKATKLKKKNHYGSMTMKSFFLIFSWRIIALQYCVAFCHTATWISHRHTFVLSLLNLSSMPHLIPAFYVGAPYLSFLHHRANSYLLSISSMVIIYFNATLYSFSLFFPLVSTSLFSISVSPC